MTSSSLLPGLTSMFIYPREALFFHGRAYTCTCMRNNRHSTIHSYLAPFGSPRISETKLHISLTAFLLGTRQKNKLQNHREAQSTNPSLLDNSHIELFEGTPGTYTRQGIQQKRCPNQNPPPNPTANPAPSATNPETSSCAAKSTSPSPRASQRHPPNQIIPQTPPPTPAKTKTMRTTTTMTRNPMKLKTSPPPQPLSNPTPGTSSAPAPAGSA